MESILANMKEVDVIERFKSGIKKWKPESFPCRLCKFSYNKKDTSRLNQKYLLIFHVFPENCFYLRICTLRISKFQLSCLSYI